MANDKTYISASQSASSTVLDSWKKKREKEEVAVGVLVFLVVQKISNHNE